MKRIIMMMLAAILSLSVFAQKDVTKFLGIPVDGSEDTMARKLEAKGFKIVLRESGCVTMEGVFNGAKSKIWTIRY